MAGYLAGKVVVVTGGGRGLGRAIGSRPHARAPASWSPTTAAPCIGREGASSTPADEVVAEIAAAGGQAVAAAEDVSTMEGGRRVVQAAVDASAGSTGWCASRVSRSRSTCGRWTNTTGTT